MTVLNVPDMHCEMCASRITKALTAAGLAFTVSLPDKTVTIDGCDHCVATAVNTLTELGYTPVKA